MVGNALVERSASFLAGVVTILFLYVLASRAEGRQPDIVLS
jgi:hypothetical protein